MTLSPFTASRRRVLGAAVGAAILTTMPGCDADSPAPTPATPDGPGTPTPTPSTAPQSKYAPLRVPEGAEPMAVAQTKDGVRAFYGTEETGFRPAGKEVHFTINQNGKPVDAERGKMPDVNNQWVAVTVGPPALNSDGSFAADTPFIKWEREQGTDRFLLESFVQGEGTSREFVSMVPQGEEFQVPTPGRSAAD